MTPRSNTLTVVRNHDYTISVVDSKGRKLFFRDITGKDLEYLDNVIRSDGEDETHHRLTFDQIIDLLSMLCLRDFDFRNLTRRTIAEIFEAIKEHILCNYISKYTWLKQCYSIQNGSFAGVQHMEEVPMTKFIAMIQIHQEAIESINKTTE